MREQKLANAEAVKALAFQEAVSVARSRLQMWGLKPAQRQHQSIRKLAYYQAKPKMLKPKP